jgi:hypothetical protein
MGALKLDIFTQPPDEDCQANSYTVYLPLIRTFMILRKETNMRSVLRVVFQITAFALALTSFTGCGGDSTSSDKVDSSNANGVYVIFGRAMGYMQNTWVDVHGAGAQRSDPKAGDPNDYPTGKGPQGDAIRIYNYIRLVRDAGSAVGFAVVDSGQAECYSNINAEITCPAAGEAFYGQDAQHTGNASSFIDNGNGTITDSATGLMWTQDDSANGLNWEEALAWVVQMNAANYLGNNDWRLPNAKELQSIVDYTRSPDTTSSAAIDPLFNVTSITNEAGQTDFPAYWSSTTHVNWITT